MKKIILTLGLAALCCMGANAQSLSDFLKGAGKALSNAAASTTSSIFDITGTWKYNGCALGASSDDILTSLAASAGTATVEAKCDELLAKAGIKAGAATLTFAADGNFTLTAGKLNIPGSWTKDGTSIEITFTKLFSLKMKGKVTRTTEGCSVLFESEKFVTFAKNVLDVAGKLLSSNATVSALQTAIKNIDGLQLGFKLVK